MARVEFSVCGSISTPLSLDPEEFRGMTLEQAKAAVRATLEELASGVNWWPDEVEWVASELLRGG